MTPFALFWYCLAAAGGLVMLGLAALLVWVVYLYLAGGFAERR
ncbi:MAG TPA: hypothetical protein VFU47_03460 [Armatimonadota bacterium]|nr:hypothetical protein [Armatimonadota bacterium]